jgi:hypothetical protein
LCSFFSLLLARAACGRGHHYWVMFKHEARWPPKRSFICFGPLSNFPKTIAHAPNYIFPSFANDTHIVGPMSEITCAFGHLLTQLALVRLRVKVSKCKLWSPLRISQSIDIPQGYILVTYGLCILGVPMSSQDFATHFLNEALSQNMAHIDDLPLLGDAQVVLGISSSCVVCRPSYFTRTILISSSFVFFFN